MKSSSLSEFAKKIALILAIGGGLFILYQLRFIILLIFVLIIISYALLPVVEWFEKFNIPRSVTTIGVLLIVLSIVLGVSASIINALGSEYVEFSESLVENYNELREQYQLDQYLGSITTQDLIIQVGGFLQDSVSTGLRGILGIGSSLFGLLFTLLTAITILFYLIYEPGRIFTFGVKILPKKYQQRTESILHKIQDQLSKWLQGQLLLMIVMAVTSYILFLVTGIPYPLLLGLLVGILDIIPVIGPLIALIPVVLITALDSPVKVVIALLIFVGLQVLEGNVLVPRIMSKTVGLDPLYVIIALMVGSTLGGTLGAILAIPGSVILKILYEEFQSQQH
jgi:predicted PurR-regulated permease PerM